MLHGSVRKSSDRIRVNAHLVDTIAGNEIWAERFDSEVQNVFNLQNEVAQHVVDNLAIRLTKGEEKKLANIPTRNPDARDAFLKGLALINPPTPDNLARARSSFQRAIELDNKYAGGYAGVSFTTSVSVLFGNPPNRSILIDSAVETAQAAIALDSSFAFSYSALAFALYTDRQFEKAIDIGRKAVELEPSNSDAYAFLSLYRAYGGEPDLAVQDALTALRLAPKYVGPIPKFFGVCEFSSRQFQ